MSTEAEWLVCVGGPHDGEKMTLGIGFTAGYDIQAHAKPTDTGYEGMQALFWKAMPVPDRVQWLKDNWKPTLHCLR